MPPTLQLLAEHGEEDGEVDGTAGLLDHGLQLLILHVQLACTERDRGFRADKTAAGEKVGKPGISYKCHESRHQGSNMGFIIVKLKTLSFK